MDTLKLLTAKSNI